MKLINEKMIAINNEQSLYIEPMDRYTVSEAYTTCCFASCYGCVLWDIKAIEG